MLELKIPETELFDDRTGEFITIDSQVLQLEHSLISLAKWESKWNKPFLDTGFGEKKGKTVEEAVDYIRCMTITKNVDPNVYRVINEKMLKEVNDYVDLPMTATTFSQSENQRGGHEVITAEIIYYWMISLEIPFECQRWHLNRLLTLIKVCSIKNKPSKKMSRSELAKRNSSLNAARRAKYGHGG